MQLLLTELVLRFKEDEMTAQISHPLDSEIQEKRFDWKRVFLS